MPHTYRCAHPNAKPNDKPNDKPNNKPNNKPKPESDKKIFFSMFDKVMGISP